MTDTQPASENSLVWLHRYSVFTAASTLFLLVAGAMVKSTESGLAVPDWPLSFGRLMPPMVGGVFYEHGHRMVATGVGLLTMGLVAWVHLREPRAWVRRLSLAALATVVTQGCLGGMTVLLKLPPFVSIMHAGLAQIFFCIVLSMAVFISPWWRHGPEPLEAEGATGLTGWAAGLTVAVYLQVLLGALVRHFGAALAFPDFPLAGGQLLPSLQSFPQALTFIHRTGALAVTLLALLVLRRARRLLVRRGPACGGALIALRRAAWAVPVLLSAQLTLGACVVWTGRSVHVTSSHLVVGAMLLGSSLLLTLVSARTARDPETATGPAAELVEVAA